MSAAAEKGNKNDASTDLSSLIMQVGSTWAVKSNPNEPFFRVFIDINNIIISCDCLAFITTRVPCSHMCMLKWYNKGIIVAPENQPFQPYQLPSQFYPYPQQPYPVQQPAQQPVQQLNQQPTHQLAQQPAQQPAQQLAIQPVSLAQTQPPPKLPTTAAAKQPLRTLRAAQPSQSTPSVDNPATKRTAHPTAPLRAKRKPKARQAPATARRADNLGVGSGNKFTLPKTTQPSPQSEHIQQQLQIEMQQHLQQSQLQKCQAKETQKSPERERNLSKLIEILTELNTRYKKIKPSSSTSPPSLPPYINADIAQRGQKIALEAQLAMQSGLEGVDLEKFITDRLNQERQDVAKHPSTSTAGSSSSSTLSPVKSTSPTTNLLPSNNPNAESTAVTSSSTLNKSTSKDATSPAAPNITRSSGATPSLPATTTATVPLPSSSAPAKTPASSTSPEASSITGKRRRALPSFAISPSLKTTRDMNQPETKLIKTECAIKSHKYPLVEPVEGYNAAIERMINNMNNEKNSASDPWNISSSDEDDDDDEDNEDNKK
ncbi:hypothetical protein [Parasitella parasitica]|uniref:SWIM-type domain-containing protein n=1 Tax=Parasitella parasitica TaxID=35722 RepID=A0A0B7NHW7_9FUNG|nr:hypothetical protein [Parasitella parasitica]